MSDQRLTLKRRYSTARRRVFEAWTRPPQLRRWAFPDTSAPKSVRIDLFPGGNLELVLMAGARRTRRWGTFRQVQAPRHLTFTWTCNGLGLEGRPTRVTVDIDGGDTEATLTLTQEGLPDPESRTANLEAWEQLLEALERFLASEAPSPAGRTDGRPAVGAG